MPTPAYPINLNDVVEVIIAGRLFGQQTLSVFHYLANGPTSTPDGPAALDALAAALKGAGGLMPKYLLCCAKFLGEDYLSVQKIASTRWVKRTYTWTRTNGNIDDDCLGPNIAVAVTKRGTRADRHNIGTLHMPAVPNAFFFQGDMMGAAVTAYTDLGNQVKAEIIAGGVTWVPVIFNRAAPLTSQAIDNTVVQLSLRTMHRRTVGLGA